MLPSTKQLSDFYFIIIFFFFCWGGIINVNIKFGKILPRATYTTKDNKKKYYKRQLF